MPHRQQTPRAVSCRTLLFHNMKLKSRSLDDPNQFCFAEKSFKLH